MWVMVPYVRVSRRERMLKSRASPKSATLAAKPCLLPEALRSSTLPARRHTDPPLHVGAL